MAERSVAWHYGTRAPAAATTAICVAEQIAEAALPESCLKAKVQLPAVAFGDGLLQLIAYSMCQGSPPVALHVKVQGAGRRAVPRALGPLAGAHHI